MRHFLLGLAVIFITISAVEGQSTSPSPTASPQAKESPAKQPTPKKAWLSTWASSAKRAPAKPTASPSSTSPVVEGAKPKQRNTAATTGTPSVTSTSSSREASAKPTVTPAPGGGNGLVWVNTASHVYHTQKSRWYGKTKEGKYMTEEEAKADGNRAARSSE